MIYIIPQCECHSTNENYASLVFCFHMYLTLKVLVATIDALGHFETG